MAFNHQSNRRQQRGLARTTSVSATSRKLSEASQKSTNLVENNTLNDKLTSDEHQHLQESYSLATSAGVSNNNSSSNQSSNINNLFANLFSSSSTGNHQHQSVHVQQSKELENTIQLTQFSNANQNMLPPSTSTGAMSQVSDGQLALRNNVSANSSQNNKQRQPMCPECEKSLPNQIVFDKIEAIIRLMQDEQTGVPVRTAKSFMSKIPSVFTGVDLIQWMMKNLKLDDQMEAHHLANLIASHGYIFPIEDHTLSIKNDCTFYRFQTPCLWPSNTNDPENTDYAVYLCKRTMQGRTRLELADYEAENLARLQKMFSRKWEFIFMQAESQAKVDKKRDKLERKVLDSQERAFWDVYRPVPGCVNTTEIDIKKACRLSKSSKGCEGCQKVASACNTNKATTSSSAPLDSSPASSSSNIAPPTDATSNQGNSKVVPSSSSPLPQHDTPSAAHQLQQVTAKSVDINDCNIPSVSTSEMLQESPASSTTGATGPTLDKSSPTHTVGKLQTLVEPQNTKSNEPVSPSASLNSSSSCHHAHHHSHVHTHSHGHNHGHSHNHPHQHHHHHHHPCQHHHQHHQHQYHHHQHAHQHHAPPSNLASTNNPPIATCHAETIKTAVAATPNVASSLNVSSTSQQRSVSPSNASSSEKQPSVEATAQLSSNNKESFLQQTAKRLSIGGRKSIDSNMGTAHQQRQRIKSAAFVSTDMDVSDEKKQNLKMYESCDSPRTGQSDQSIDNQQHTHHHHHHLSATSTKSLSSNAACKLCESGNFEPTTIKPRRDSESNCRQRSTLIPTTPANLHEGSMSQSSESESGDPTGGDSLMQSNSEQSKSTKQNKTSSNVINTKNSSSTSITNSAQHQQNIGNLEKELESLKIRLDRRIGGVKMSKVTQSYLSYFQQWAEYDPFITTPIPSNPWVTDSAELWDSEAQTKDVHCRRVRRWAFSLKELLNDPAGRDQFFRFLEKEFSAENLKFWDAVQELKRVHSRDVARRIEAIWNEYLATDANCPINIDSKSYETSKKNMEKNRNNRYIFDEAAGHVYQLMKNDSYPRYLRSDMYKDYKEASEKKRSNQVAFDVFKPQITTLKHKFNF